MAQNELFEEARKQFKAEYGTETMPEHRPDADHLMAANHITFDSSCPGCQALLAFNTLRQKYGLSAPDFTNKEQKMIAREQRQRFKKAFLHQSKAKSNGKRRRG